LKSLPGQIFKLSEANSLNVFVIIAGVDDRESREAEADQPLVDTLQKLKGICKLRDLKRPSPPVVDLMTESRLRKLVKYV
jgi:hypothetical protein